MNANNMFDMAIRHAGQPIKDNLILLQKQHTALLAVAEAAKVCCEVLPSQLAGVSIDAMNKLHTALATLAQIQKGE